MADDWDMVIVYNTLIPYTWYAGVVAKLKEITIATEGYELDENGDYMPI